MVEQYSGQDAMQTQIGLVVLQGEVSATPHCQDEALCEYPSSKKSMRPNIKHRAVIASREPGEISSSRRYSQVETKML
jgi:hypothetical protein